MKKISALGITIAVAFFWTVVAFGYPVTDTTLVQVNNNTGGTFGWQDVVPAGPDSPFNILGMDILRTDLLLNLQVTSNYGGLYSSGGIDTFGADLFLDVGLTGTWDYGVAFSNEGAFDATLGGIFSVAGVKTSYHYFKDYGSSVFYGQKWLNPWSEAMEYVPVVIGDGSVVVGDANLIRSLEGDPYTYSLAIDLANLGIDPGLGIGIFYASANCGNDIMAAESTAPVPEPATMLLLGSGLVGIAGLGRRFRKR